MTNQEILLDYLHQMQCHQEAVSKHPDKKRLPGQIRFGLNELCDALRMVEWFANDQPAIWPEEMRYLAYNCDAYAVDGAKAAGYNPRSDLAKKLFDLRTEILRAEAAAADVPWETMNDIALFAALRNLEATATWLIKAVDMALKDRAREEEER